MEVTIKKPKGYENDLSEYGIAFYDMYGEPIAWGFEIRSYLGKERFYALGEYGSLECVNSGYSTTWYVVIKSLTFQEAIKKYGKVTELITGPKGGWKNITFGKKKFGTRKVKPSWQEQKEFIDPSVIKIEK